MKKHAAPIFAALLLLLPLVYLGTYLALVVPSGMTIQRVIVHREIRTTEVSFETYRFGVEPFAERIFWPLEWIDRKVRTRAWNNFDRNAVLHGVHRGPVYYTP